MALIRPFLPAKDFAASKAFYAAIGFRLDYHDDKIAIFDFEGAGWLPVRSQRDPLARRRTTGRITARPS